MASKGPTREAVTAALQQEANSLKADGEKLDPVLRVKATWTVEGLDITERPNDADKPWAGKIRFKIKSETKDTDGKVVVDEFNRQFDYVYTTSVAGSSRCRTPAEPAADRSPATSRRVEPRRGRRSRRTDHPTRCRARHAAARAPRVPVLRSASTTSQALEHEAHRAHQVVVRDGRHVVDVGLAMSGKVSKAGDGVRAPSAIVPD
jgi:hypothetical protein